MIQNQSNLKQKIKSPLNTDEILDVLKNVNKGFRKETLISGKISNDFKKLNLVQIARSNDQVIKKKVVDSQKSEKQEKNQNLANEKKEPDSASQSNKNVNEEQVLKSVKKYTENEAEIKAKELAKQYYYYGYNLGTKNLKKELQKGDNELAVTLKNTIDNLFYVSGEFTQKLSKEINASLLKLCKEIIGYDIEIDPKRFENKILDLANSVSKSTNKVKVSLSPKDFGILKKSLENNKPLTDIELFSDKSLERGDIKVTSGEIEIEEILSNKISFNYNFKTSK
tara:strand:- start:262 stop:1107 length:846 start_codon:yes stop_codon:yes gene_type:complete